MIMSEMKLILVKEQIKMEALSAVDKCLKMAESSELSYDYVLVVLNDYINQISKRVMESK